MQKIVFTLLALAFLAISLNAQTTGVWTTYASPNKLNDVLEEDDFIFLATDAGIFAINKNTQAVEHWTKQSHGLPSNQVESIARDPFTHTMFIGTYDIALAYQQADGQFQSLPYPEELLPPIEGSPILTYCVETDQEGNWWIGTNRGLVKYNSGNWQLFSENNANNLFRSVWNIDRDNEGRLLLASHGLFRLEEDESLTMLTPSGFSDNLFAYSNGKTLYQDNGATWFLTDVGSVGRLDENGWVVYDHEDFPAGIFLRDKVLLEDQNGSVWVRSSDGRFLRFNGQIWEEANPDNDPEGADITDLFFSQSARLLFAPGELRIQDSNSSAAYSLGNYPFDSELYNFINDHQGNLWARSSYFELRNLSTGESIALTDENGVNLYFYELAFDPQGVLWGLSFTNLRKFENGTWTVFDHTNSILPNSTEFRQLAIDDNGVVYVEVQDDGIYRFDGQAWTHITYSLLTNNYILDMETDQEGHLWLSILLETTWETRIYRFDGQNLSLKMDGYELTNTSTLIKDPQNGRLYAAGSGNHLEYWDNGTWSNFPLPLSNSPYIHLVLPKGENIVTCFENKLMIFENGAWTLFDPFNSPLPLVNIAALGLDQTGKIWITHSNYNSLETYQSGVVSGLSPQVNAVSALEIEVFPNPTPGFFKIDIKGQEDYSEAFCRVFDINGRLLQQFELKETLVDISGLTPGMYWLQVQNKGQIGLAKLIKK